MGIWKSAVFESYPRNWLQKVKGPATAPRRKQWSSGPGGGSSSEMAKGPALREEVRSQVTSPKGPVSRPVPCSPKPEQRPWLAEAYPCPLLLIFRIYTLLFDHGNVVTICFYRKDNVRIISSLWPTKESQLGKLPPWRHDCLLRRLFSSETEITHPRALYFSFAMDYISKDLSWLTKLPIVQKGKSDRFYYKKPFSSCFNISEMRK